MNSGTMRQCYTSHTEPQDVVLGTAVDSGRLWSLWDMLSLNGESFYRATSRLLLLRARIGELGRSEIERRPEGGVIVRIQADPVVAMELQTMVSELIQNLETLDTKVTLRLARKLLAAVSDPEGGFLWGEVNNLSERIHDILPEELSEVMLFVLEGQKTPFYAPADPLFGHEVAAKFVSIEYDMAEAGKCLALERSTASVFHSVRCLEAAIQALSRCLRIPDPTKGADRTWGRLLGALKGEIERRWPPGVLAGHGTDAQFFGVAYAALAGMMNPWRNDTMHLAEKYTEEEARHIFEVVRGLMRRVASRCDEDGKPQCP